MHRWLCGFVFVLCLSEGLYSQNLTKIKTDIQSNKLVAALTEIEKGINSGRGSGHEFHYLRFKVLSLISSDSKLKDSMLNSRSRSLESLKKALEIDRQKTISELIGDNYKPIYNLYLEGFQEGVYQYNTGRYKQAYDVFGKTSSVGEFIRANGWGLQNFDTTLTFYLGLSAYKSNATEQALNHFRTLAEMNISGKPEWVTVYQVLTTHHYEKLKNSNVKNGNPEYELMHFAESGMKHYPENDYIPLLLVRYFREHKDRENLFKKYRELVSKFPQSINLVLAYANDLFSVTHLSGTVQMNKEYEQQCQLIEDLYKKAVNIDPNAYDVLLNLGKHYYNQCMQIEKQKESEQYKQLKDELIDRSIPLFEKVFDQLMNRLSLNNDEHKDLASTYQMLTYTLNQKNNPLLRSVYDKRYQEKIK